MDDINTWAARQSTATKLEAGGALAIVISIVVALAWPDTVAGALALAGIVAFFAGRAMR